MNHHTARWSIDGWYTDGEPMHPDEYRESLIRTMTILGRFRDIEPQITQHTEAYIRYWGTRKMTEEKND